MIIFKRLLLVVGFVGVACALSGCSADKSGTNDVQGTTTTNSSTEDHSGWWCKEHGIPEEQCSMCSATAAKTFKEKGDWCNEHNRAESQCFECDPSRAEKFAKLYEAKYGKKPPAITE
jgi:hypothetical protein